MHDRHSAEPPSAGSFFIWMLLLLLGGWTACSIVGCAGMYPPRDTRHPRSEPRGTKTVAELLTEPFVSAPDLLPAGQGHIRLRVTNCYARTITIVSRGPVDLCAEARIEPVEDHRRLVVTWDYVQPGLTSFAQEPSEDEDAAPPDKLDGSVGKSEQALDGANEVILHQVKIPGLSGGTYDVVATIFTATKACSNARVTVKILN